MKTIRYVGWSIVVSLLIATFISLVLSLLPTKFGTIDVNASLTGIRSGFEKYSPLIGLIAVLALLLPNIRGTLKYIAYESPIRHSLPTTLIGVWLFVCAIKLAGNVSLIANHPARYGYLADLFLILGLTSAVFHLLKPAPVDTPIGALEPDSEIDNRKALSKDQIAILENLKSILGNNARVQSLGLFGDWGVGKSSIMQVCQKEMTAENSNIIWANLEPWRYTSQEALTLGFYRTIGDAIERQVPGLQRSAGKLLELADPLVKKYDRTGLFATISKALHTLFNKHEANPEQYISDVLEREGKRLIVIIDNVERIYRPEDVYRVLQLAHYLRQSKNITYVFVAEKEKLLACVPNHHDSDSTAYLEKFIEHELHVPQPSRNGLVETLNDLLKSRDDYIPKDFSLNGLMGTLEDSATYRGIIRTFNQFIYNLEKFFIDDEYAIKLEDKYVLDHILVKYPVLWLHIQANRSLYVGKLHDFDWNLLRGFNEKKDLEDDTKSIKSVLDKLGLDDVGRSAIEQTLSSLFPKIQDALRGNGRQTDNYDTLLNDKRAAHPDILDVYFASSEPHEEYQSTMRQIKSLLKDLKHADDAKRIKLFSDYLDQNKGSDNSDYLVHLRHTLKSSLKGRPSLLRSYMRSLLRAYLSSISYLSGEHDRGALTKLLGAINDFGIEYLDDQEELDKYMDYIFEDFEKYSPHPTVLLRIGLFTIPERGNNFISFERWTKYPKFRRRLLRFVSTYYIGHESEYTIFSESRNKEWRFVFYQWALGIRAGLKPENPMRGLKAIKINANKYLFDILANNHKLAYDRIKGAHWYKQWDTDPEPKWQISTENLEPYDMPRLKRLVKALAESPKLSKAKKAEMKELLDMLNS